MLPIGFPLSSLTSNKGFGSFGEKWNWDHKNCILRLGRRVCGPFWVQKWCLFGPKINFLWPASKKCYNHDGSPKRQPLCWICSVFSLHFVKKNKKIAKKKKEMIPKATFLHKIFLLSHLTPYCCASSVSRICCCSEDSSHRWIFRNMMIISSFNLSKDNPFFLSWSIRIPRNKCWFILGQDFQRPVLKFKPITQQVAILKICFFECPL